VHQVLSYTKRTKLQASTPKLSGPKQLGCRYSSELLPSELEVGFQPMQVHRYSTSAVPAKDQPSEGLPVVVLAFRLRVS
jgi:hypothetical protein